MRLKYSNKVIGTIVTNHSMSVDDAIEILKVNINKYEDYELFNIDFLDEKYVDWRKVSEEMLVDGMNGSLDCGEASVREDFSNFANLDEYISFDDMYELEKWYEA